MITTARIPRAGRVSSKDARVTDEETRACANESIVSCVSNNDEIHYKQTTLESDSRATPTRDASARERVDARRRRASPDSSGWWHHHLGD